MVQPLIDEAEIRRRYARLTAGEQMPDLLAEDIVINQSAEIPGTAGTFQGLEGVRAMQDELARYDEQGRLKRLDVHGEWDEARRAAAEDSW